MPQTLHLCYVADASNIHVKRWISYFVARGHRITCLSDKGGEIAGVEVLPLPNRDTLLAEGRDARKTAVVQARAKKIRQLVRELKPDVLHAIFLYQRGWSAALSGEHPLVMTLLGSDIYLPRHHYRHPFHIWRDRLLNKFSLRQSDLITAVTDDLGQAANRMTAHGVPVELVPIGTDTELFQPDVDTRDLRAELNIPEGAFVVFSPRQITPLYNQDIIIQSIPAVLEKLPNAIFLMKDTFCETDERRAFVAWLKSMADSLGVSHAIRWDEEVPMKELPAYYNLSDVVVSVPSTDGMPVTFFDAMACRKPLIVGDLPSYNEVIMHGQTGLRVPTRSAQPLAQAIIRLATHPELMQKIIEESQVILQQYGIFDQQMAHMERFYFSLKTNKASKTYKRPGSPLDRLLFKALLAWT